MSNAERSRHQKAQEHLAALWVGLWRWYDEAAPAVKRGLTPEEWGQVDGAWEGLAQVLEQALKAKI